MSWIPPFLIYSIEQPAHFGFCRLSKTLVCTQSTRTGALSLSCIPSITGSASDGVKTHQTCATCHYSIVKQSVHISSAQPLAEPQEIAKILETALKQQQDNIEVPGISHAVGSLASGASLQGDDASPTFIVRT